MGAALRVAGSARLGLLHHDGWARLSSVHYCGKEHTAQQGAVTAVHPGTVQFADIIEDQGIGTKMSYTETTGRFPWIGPRDWTLQGSSGPQMGTWESRE